MAARYPSSTCRGNPRAVKSRGNPRWWSNIILSPRKTGGFFRGARHATPRQSGARHVKVGPGARHVNVSRLWVQGLDTSRRCHLTGARLTKSSPPTGVHAFSAAICRQVFHHAGSARSYSVDWVFFSFSIHRIRHCAHFDTSPPGALTGVTGLMGSLLDLMWRSRGC